jgi:hypothetical protein
MTRQHFELVADLLHELGDTLDLRPDQRAQAAQVTARTLAATNPRFKPDTFEDRATYGSRQWVTIESTPGYLPDSEPATFITRREAERHAFELVGELRELGYSVTGSARVGTWHATNGSAHDLGRVVEVRHVGAML